MSSGVLHQGSCHVCKTLGLLVGGILVPGVVAAAVNCTLQTNDTEVVVQLTSKNDAELTEVFKAPEVKSLKAGRIAGDIGTVLQLKSTEANDFPDGILLDGVQLRAFNTGVLGTGPIRIVKDTGAIYHGLSAELTMAITNRIELGEGSWIASDYKESQPRVLEIHNLAAGENNQATKRVVIGRSGTGEAGVRLALDGEDNGPIGEFTLRGNLHLEVDGGAIRIAGESAGNPVFAPASTQSTPTIRATTKDLAFGVAAGADRELGLVPEFLIGDDVAETVVPANASFENTSVGASVGEPWTVSFTNKTDGSNGYVQENGGGFLNSSYPGYYTPYGKNVLMLRRHATAKVPVSLPSTGRWRFSVACGSRPDGNYSLNMPFELIIDQGLATETRRFFAGEQVHVFKTCSVEAENLAAGEHTFTIQTGNNGIAYGCLLFDNVKVERVVPGRTAHVTKTGSGALSVGDLALRNTLTVGEGTLALTGAYSNAYAAEVASGATLALSGAAVCGSTIRVASGGTLDYRTVGDTVLVDGSFEQTKVVGYTPISAADYRWKMAYLGENVGRDMQSGIQHNGSAMSTAEPWTTVGEQTLYLRNESTATQSFTVPEAGLYRLSFLQASRRYGNSQKLGLTVKIDGESVLFNAGKDAHYDFYRTEKDVELSAGAHTLVFETDAGSQENGAMVLLDDVSVRPVADRNTIDAASELHLDAGSTLILGNIEKIVVDQVYVGGELIRGGRRQLEAKGVTVVGNGAIQCGKPLGLILSVR